jgi:magnesium chelatase family protein
MSLLPPLSFAEQLAITKIHSLAGVSDGHITTTRPFRSPHHTASLTSIIGGGAKAKPGEISLAHLGVLFLDELPEYPRMVLEALRQPLEDKVIALSRAHLRVRYPADFMLVATMNPCPCGFYGDPDKECTCSSVQILNYQKRLSGPLLDRIDLIIYVKKVDQNKLLMLNSLNKNQQLKVLMLIKSASDQQQARYNSSVIYNGSLSSSDVKKQCRLSPDATQLLHAATSRLDLSARSYFKLIKVAQTIADMAKSPLIQAEHVSEALQFRTRLTP